MSDAAGMARRGLRRGARLAGICALSLVLGACSLFLSSATQGMAEDLAAAIRNQDDPQTVRDGAPAYLLLIDSLIAGDPGDVRPLPHRGFRDGTASCADAAPVDRAGCAIANRGRLSA